MMSGTQLEVVHDSHIGNVRRHAREVALRLGGDEVTVGKAALLATELATNLVRHGQGGEVLFREVREEEGCAFELHAIDCGPGIQDVAACLRDGYSMGGTAGMGMGAIRNLAEDFRIYSQPERGTVMWARFRISGRASRAGHFIHCGISAALKGEEMCGDAWSVQEFPGGLRVMLADGLGHGPPAAGASAKAVAVFRNHDGRVSPQQCLRMAHGTLLGKREAAASVVEISRDTGEMTFAGVGNVMGRLVCPDGSRIFMGENGTLGGSMDRIMEDRSPWDAESVLVLHSDGISSRWSLEQYPGLRDCHPALIAGVLHRDFRKGHDDSTVVVIREVCPERRETGSVS